LFCVEAAGLGRFVTGLPGKTCGLIKITTHNIYANWLAQSMAKKGVARAPPRQKNHAGNAA
jgi:hypothetical protein